MYIFSHSFSDLHRCVCCSSDDVTFRWILNEAPNFLHPDKRRFVSQTTGNLYISKVEPSDFGNYSCYMSSLAVSKSVISPFIPLIPLAERKYWRINPGQPKDAKMLFI